MFRQFFDTSFNDYRQVRVVVQELSHNRTTESSTDFQRFCTSLFDHKTFRYEQFKLEYCFVKEKLTIAESSLNDIQLYRRPFAFIFFTVCYSSEQLRLVLDQYTKIKQREKGVYIHLFVLYKTTDSDDEDEAEDEDNMSNDEKLINDTNEEPDYIRSSRPSISSMVSIDFYQPLSHPLAPFKHPDSVSNDGSGSIPSDHASLTDSINGTLTFNAITTDNPDNNEEANVSVGINKKSTNDSKPASKLSILKDKTMQTTNIFDSFDSDLTRVLHRLENSLSKYALESKGFDKYVSSIDSQLADIRLMIDCEKDCSLFENQNKYHHSFLSDRIFKSVLNEFDMRTMIILFNQYLKANTNLSTETGKNKLPKKLIDARTIKRKGDCCLLLGAIEKAFQDYRRAADVLKAQNDLIWHAAALEARVAASYASIQKPRRHLQKTISFLKQNTLTRRLSVEKYFNRSNSPLHLQDRMELALQIYNTANRSSFNKITWQFELDGCLRWCSLLWEQNDVKKYQDDIDQYITRINRLGSYLEEHIDSIYLNAYLAETYDFIGLKRKGALYYRSAAFSGLTLLTEQEGYNDEINFFDALIKRARTGYGIDDNRLIFPLIQKTIINESIQISYRNDDFTTIIENVHFAIESLMEYMTDTELEALLTFLNASEESIACSYCSIPRLKSLDILPLSNRLKAWKGEPKSNIFIYHAKRPLPDQQQSLHRKVDFFWIKNQQVQIALEVENYLPATMIIDQLEFLSENKLFTKLDTEYKILSRTTKRLLIDCIPKEIGQLQIQGLRYHIWSTNQEFRFGDFPTIRHCSCSADVVDELPILDIEYLLINDIKIDLSSTSTIYNARVDRGEDVFVALGLINTSNECPINTLEIEAFVSNLNMTEYIKILKLDLPILINKKNSLKIDITEIYDHCLSRQNRSVLNLEELTIEFRLNYSNESSITSGYYRRNITELCLNYFSSLTFQINDIQNDEDDLSYLMCCTIDNHLSEGIAFENNIIKSSESSLISVKQKKIKLNTLSSDLNQLINDIRTQLPTHIYYKTVDSNKQGRLLVDFQYFTNEKIQNHLNILIESPYTCYWHFEKNVNILQIHLCVISKYYQIEKLEFIFPLLNNIRFLNSNKIIFNNIQQEEYLMAERTLIFSQENHSDILIVDVIINNITWKRITFNILESIK